MDRSPWSNDPGPGASSRRPRSSARRRRLHHKGTQLHHPGAHPGGRRRGPDLLPHFPGKDHLILAVIADLIDDACTRFRAAAKGYRIRSIGSARTSTASSRAWSAPTTVPRFITSERWRLQALYPEDVAVGNRGRSPTCCCGDPSGADLGLVAPAARVARRMAHDAARDGGLPPLQLGRSGWARPRTSPGVCGRSALAHSVGRSGSDRRNCRVEGIEQERPEGPCVAGNRRLNIPWGVDNMTTSTFRRSGLDADYSACCRGPPWPSAGEIMGSQSGTWMTRFSGTTFQLVVGADPFCGSLVPDKHVR